MTKRFITRQDLIDKLDTETMKSFIYKILEQIEDCQENSLFTPNLEKLGHDVLQTAFQHGLVDINGGCPGCGGSCHSQEEKNENLPNRKPDSSGNGKVIPFKRLH